MGQWRIRAGVAALIALAGCGGSDQPRDQIDAFRSMARSLEFTNR